MSKEKTNNKNESFEESLQNAREIVKKLEDGDCTLDEMLSLYEKGIKSVEYCNSKLAEFEDKVRIINMNNETDSKEK